jgi:hypothetical protein
VLFDGTIQEQNLAAAVRGSCGKHVGLNMILITTGNVVHFNMLKIYGVFSQSRLYLL